LFVLDLLGRFVPVSVCHLCAGDCLSRLFGPSSCSHRDTPAAKIFALKSEEDFRHSMVVTKYAKALGWLCVVLVNCFFVFFSMLRGLQRGLDWQVLSTATSTSLIPSVSSIYLSMLLLPPHPRGSICWPALSNSFSKCSSTPPQSVP
jgi:hypothetical protein